VLVIPKRAKNSINLFFMFSNSLNIMLLLYQQKYNF
jgi:hypothetical protein